MSISWLEEALLVKMGEVDAGEVDAVEGYTF